MVRFSKIIFKNKASSFVLTFVGSFVKCGNESCQKAIDPISSNKKKRKKEKRKKEKRKKTECEFRVERVRRETRDITEII